MTTTIGKQQYVTKTRYSDKDPIYYNLTLNKGFTAVSNGGGFTTPANITEINTSPILFESGDWYVSIMRCTIPTSVIPKYIFPIQTGSTQNDINLAYNTFTFRYATAPNVYLDTVLLTNQQITATFQSELLNPYPVDVNPLYSLPKPPSQNNGVQDISGYYYFVYNTELLVKIFNTTMTNLWNGYTYTPIGDPPVVVPGFVSAMASDHGIILPNDIEPFFTYDQVSQLWSFNAESVYFGQDHYPRVEVFFDDLTLNNTYTISEKNVQPTFVKDQFRATVDDLVTNSLELTINAIDYTFYQMQTEESSVVGYAAFQKIVFEIYGDLSLKHNETDSIPLNFGQNTMTSYQKPSVSMLTDLEVFRENWAKSSAFIQYQQSSIEQVRLIRLAQKNSIQNFTISVFWIDNYGNKRPIELPSDGNPLTIKMAFFNKDFKA